MLVKKEIDDLTTQKILCFGTILLLLTYLMRFIKYVSNRSYYLRDRNQNPPPQAPACNLPQSQNPTTEALRDEKRSRRRRKRHHKYMAEQWLPKLDPRNDHYDEYWMWVTTNDARNVQSYSSVFFVELL